MGLKGLMSAMGMNGFATAALVICFVVFVAILVWTWTRPKSEIDRHARLCLDETASDEESRCDG